ncbi:hypothetical protein EDB85DRAFT_2154100 [Lactarius pseudohatsudake]|nr:hypothetical protein EDB85DRAFT_2154100 [Lactarius pseudohatsudake]
MSSRSSSLDSAYTRHKNGHGGHNPNSHLQRASPEELPRDNGQLATRRGKTAYTRHKNGHASHNPNSHSQRASSEELPRDNGQLATRHAKTSKEAFVQCGKYLLRCVHPFISVDQLIYTAQDHMYPIDYTIIEETHAAYAVHWSAALMFSASLRKRVKQQDPEMKDVEQALSEGMRNGRSSDAYHLKTNTAMLVSKTEDNLTLSRDSKSDRGFNHDTFGRLLIPIQHFTEYESDPVRTKVNGGVKGYKVTAHDAPAFLYEDPSKYNPDDVLSGFMRGYFLARCLRMIFTGPRTAIRRLRPNQKPSRTCVARLFNLESVSSSIVAYVAIQARFALSSQQAWSGKDEDFDYEEFADNIFKVFDENEEWAEQTIRWWNMELFGKEDGSKLTEPTQANASNGFLAKARAQTAKRRADEAAAEMAAADEAAAEMAAADEAAAEMAAAERAAAEMAAAEEAAAERAAAEMAAAERTAAKRAAAERAAPGQSSRDRATTPGSPLTPSESGGNVRANTPPPHHHNNNMEAPRSSQKRGNENDSQDEEQDLRVSNKKRPSQKKRARRQY